MFSNQNKKFLVLEIILNVSLKKQTLGKLYAIYDKVKQVKIFMYTFYYKNYKIIKIQIIVMLIVS